MAQLSLFDVFKRPFQRVTEAAASPVEKGEPHSDLASWPASWDDEDVDPFDAISIEYWGDDASAQTSTATSPDTALDDWLEAVISDEAPLLPWRLEESTAKRTARAQIKDGWIVVAMPKRWPKGQRPETIEQLRQQVQAQFARDWSIVRQAEATMPLVSLRTMDALRPWVVNLNHETYQQPLSKIRIGQSKHSRLAQMNVSLKTLTVSKYCLSRVPEAALRYLIVHELAHLIEANHSRAFWSLVAQFVPDYRKQSALMQAFHRVRVFEDAKT